jgi:hypothetical protein
VAGTKAIKRGRQADPWYGEPMQMVFLLLESPDKIRHIGEMKRTCKRKRLIFLAEPGLSLDRS